MAKPKKSPFDFGALNDVIKENEKKNTETIKDVLERDVAKPTDENNNFAIEENINDQIKLPDDEPEDTSIEEEIIEDNEKDSSTKKKPPGRPAGSKNKIQNSNLNGNPLNSLLQQKITKVPASIYLEEPKMRDIDKLCKKYNVSRNELICFLIDYSLKNLE